MKITFLKSYLLRTKLLIIPLVVISLQSCEQKPKISQKPNVLLIVADDQGWGDLGIHGNNQLNTPRIDSLGKEGAIFTRFYVSPVCSPTRAEILTGRYHPRGGVYDTSSGGERLDLDEETIGEFFLSNGYRTGIFGKWHNGTQSPYHPNNRGFEEFYGFASGHWGNYFSPMLDNNGQIVKGEGFIIDDFTNHAMDFMAESDQPFFAFLAYNTPHGPMQVPDKWWDKYKNASIPAHRFQEKENPDETRAAWALCENIDWNVGRMIDDLAKQGKLENTIIIYMSDNGPNGWRYNGGLKGIKGHTDEGGVRSPLIVFWKEHIQPSLIENIAATIDILPTLADLAGISISFKNPLDGVSLKPLLTGQQENLPDRYIFSHWNGAVSLRNQQYILDKDNQLFDLTKDPGQFSPISNPSDSLITTFLKAKENWEKNVLSELDRQKEEVFPVGFPGSKFTQLPARDGVAHGNIQRSNQFPNSSYFTNWTSESDSITFDTEILTSGNYKASVYYSCKEEAIGSMLQLSEGKNQIVAEITIAHDSGPISVEFDRYPRKNSYEKEYIILEMGEIHLEKGDHPLTLKAKEINNQDFIDFRLLVLEKLD